jgi:hypothetical protein
LYKEIVSPALGTSFFIITQHHLNTTTAFNLQSTSTLFTSNTPNNLKSAKMVSFTSASLALVAAIAMVQPVAANGGFNFAPSVHILRLRDALGGAIKTAAPAKRDESQVDFSACQTAAAQISPKPTYIIYANRTVDISGLPAVCISSLNTHNSNPNIAEINKWQGWGIVLNNTAIQTSGVGNGLTAYLETIAVNVS